MAQKYRSLNDRYQSILLEDTAPMVSPAATPTVAAPTNVQAVPQEQITPTMTPEAPGENSEDPQKEEYLSYVLKHADKLSAKNLKEVYRLITTKILDQNEGRLKYHKS